MDRESLVKPQVRFPRKIKPSKAAVLSDQKWWKFQTRWKLRIFTALSRRGKDHMWTRHVTTARKSGASGNWFSAAEVMLMNSEKALYAHAQIQGKHKKKRQAQTRKHMFEEKHFFFMGAQHNTAPVMVKILSDNKKSSGATWQTWALSPIMILLNANLSDGSDLRIGHRCSKTWSRLQGSIHMHHRWASRDRDWMWLWMMYHRKKSQSRSRSRSRFSQGESKHHRQALRHKRQFRADGWARR